MMATILVVEDDEDLRGLLCAVLTGRERILLEAEHGVAALEMIEARGVPDLILLDLNMPVMHGWKLAEELRARYLWRAPIIVITAALDAARSAQEIGAVAYLRKPFSVHALSTLVEAQLAPQLRLQRSQMIELRPPAH